MAATRYKDTMSVRINPFRSPAVKEKKKKPKLTPVRVESIPLKDLQDALSFTANTEFALRIEHAVRMLTSPMGSAVVVKAEARGGDRAAMTEIAKRMSIMIRSSMILTSNVGIRDETNLCKRIVAALDENRISIQRETGIQLV